MSRKYGKKVEIKINPLAYNIGLIGESGIGKSTTIKEFCEKLVGDDGYIMLDIGKEDGHKAINGIVSAEIPDWDTFSDFVDDVIENKTTDYKDLKVIGLDTYDQLVEIAEPEVVRMHNRANPDKRVDSINAAFGGFGKGMDKVSEIILDKLWELKKVGVSFIMIGHVKNKEIDDAATGESYSILTTNMSQKYFNAIKTKLDFLGVAYVDRKIVKEKTGKKNIATKQDIVKSKVAEESRRISFRDDNYSIDSKSRFADIVDNIPMDSDALIKAINDAIMAEHSKGEKTVDESKKEEAKEAKSKEKEVEKYIENRKATKVDEVVNAKLISEIQDKFSVQSKEVKEQIKDIMTENGFSSFRDENIPTQALEQIVNILK